MARRSTKQVHDLILAAAEREFSVKGYARTTTDDIAEAAGVSLSVLFRHYPAKADLFRDALLQPFLESLQAFNSHWEQTFGDEVVDEREVMRLFIGDFYDHLYAHRDALTALLGADHADGEITEAIHEQFDAMFAQFGRMGQREADRRGWFSGEPMELNSRVLVAMITATVAHRQWFLPTGRQRLSRERLVEHVTALMLYGLRLEPPPGESPSSGHAAPTAHKERTGERKHRA